MEIAIASQHALLAEIAELKTRAQATILSHFYEDGVIQDLADHVGDSLYLAQMGQKSKAPVVLLCGVLFMGESVKILSPEKTVLVPDLNAGCSLVDQSPYLEYLKWRHEFPRAIAVTYVNSSAAVKSISDIVCTSSNAEKIINAIPKDRQILFGPDRNLGSWLMKRTGREMEIWRGACEVHVLFSAEKTLALKREHPRALVLAHPECSEGVLQHADVIGATSRLLEEVQKNRGIDEFIVATEDGIMHQMRKSRPNVKLYQTPAEGTCACNQCPYMKLNTLEKIRSALKYMKPEVKIEPNLAAKARVGLDRMMAVTAGQPVTWPEEFTS